MQLDSSRFGAKRWAFEGWCDVKNLKFGYLVSTIPPKRIDVTTLLIFFPKQFTVGVLNATLDLAALVLVGVVGFLGSEVVLSPVVSHCLRLSPFMWGVGVGWCGRLLGLWSGLVSRCLPLSPVVSLHVGGGCWLVWSASWALKWSCLPLSPGVSLHVGGGCWLVWPPS